MDLNKSNIKKILGIITFTLVLLALLMNMGKVQSFLVFFVGNFISFRIRRRDSVYSEHSHDRY